jgi:thiamine-phosphate pyrophosphorylase
MRGLYVIVDVDVLERRGLDPVTFASATLGGKPCALQLRAKRASDTDTLALLRALRPLCSAAGVPLVANDRPDLAIVAGVDMVHVGQTDARPSLVHVVAPRLPFGISTHTPEELSDALAASPAYVAFGPVWATSTKAMPDPVVGLSGLKQAARLVAIGGVTLDRVAEISGFVAAAAVIADLVPPADVELRRAYDWVSDRARAFGQAFREPMRTSSLPEIGR